ncbi:hypothetical protein LCGC14_2427640, partial [marine sediment metagenome]
MSVVAVIPARGGSKEIPRKNLQPIGGVPLIGWAVRAALAAKSVKAVYVSTEDAEIAMVAREYGAEVIDRPTALADDVIGMLSVIRHAVDWMESPPERIVVMQCTSPFVTAGDIDQAVAKAEATDADTVGSAARDHSFICHEVAGEIVGVTFDKSEPFRNRQDFVPQWRLDGGLCVVRVSGLSTAPSLYSGRLFLHELPAERSIDIDTPLDLHLARALHEYQRQWIVIGSSPGAPEWLPVVRTRYPHAETITTNSGGLLFTLPDRPAYYFLSDHQACEEHGELAQDLAARGSRTITRKRADSALKNRGIQPLLDAITQFLPSPLDVPPIKGVDPETMEVIECQAKDSEPLAALIFKVAIMEGRKLSFVRIYSGKITTGEDLYNSSRGKREKISRILRMHANKKERIVTTGSGSIAGIVGLKESFTGDTLCSTDRPVLLEKMEFYEPVISVAVEPKTLADQEKLDQVLQKFVLEDPT